MSPAFIPTIKDLASHLTIPQAERILSRALSFKTSTHIKRYLHEQIAEIDPNVAILDTP